MAVAAPVDEAFAPMTSRNPALSALLGYVVAVAGATEPSAGVINCPVTSPGGGNYGNESLQANLPPGGKFIFVPGGGGFVDRDGALGIKFAWNRLVRGNVQVGGRRLDADAPPARAYFSDGYGNSGFQPSYLVFPTPGCWEITGGIDGARLRFVLLVEKVGDGPSWRFEGIGPGWRETTSPESVPAGTPASVPAP